MKALFISNEKFLDPSFPEGGVKFCTDEYISLIKEKFELILFGVQYQTGMGFRLKKKAGLSAYEEYDVNAYSKKLADTIQQEEITHIFLNLSNTAPFAKMIKRIAPQIGIVLCSHGNESGDFLHETGQAHRKYLARYTLGKMLSKEKQQRKYIDLVLTVSEVEENIEKWLGAKQVYMVPRAIDKKTLNGNIIPTRIGFLSDLSHEPNFYGISLLCAVITKEKIPGLELRLAGAGTARGKQLEKEFSFIKYLGHLPEKDLEQEIGTWAFGLNPVFYYSRGVSTKLGKLLGMGLPVITTDKGKRGYQWKEGEIPVGKNEEQMAALIRQLCGNEEKIAAYRKEVKRIQSSAPSLGTIMSEIMPLL